MTPRRIAAVAVALAIGVAAAAARAEPVNVQAALRADMGRIVFAWNAPVTFDSSVAGGRLTLRFGRPIEADYGRVTRTLGKYVGAVTPGGDGRSVSFALKSDVDVFAFDSGSAVIVEIVDKAPAGDKAAAASPEPPAAAAPAASGLPTVRVRTGRHPDYTRLVFDWPTSVPYSVKQDAGVATITFSRDAALDLKALTPPPPFIGGARARVGDDSVTVTLAVPKSSGLKHFLAGTKIVLDIGRPSGGDAAGPLPPDAPAAAAAKPEDKPESKPAEAARAAAPAASGPQAPPPQAVPTAGVTAETLAPPPAAAAPGSATATGAAARRQAPALATAAQEDAPPPVAGQPTRLTPRTAAPSPSPATTPAPPAITAATAPAKPTPAAAAPTLTPGRASAPSASAAAPATATAPGTAPATVTGTAATRPALAPPSQPAAASAPQQARPAAAAAAVPAATAAPATPKVAPGDAVTLRIDWKDPVGAAVFRRAGTLWVAFDKAAPIDVNALMKTGGNLIRGIEQMGTTNGTVLRIATVGGVNPGVRRDGLAWLLDFRKQPLEPETPLTITSQPESPVGARLFLPVPEPGAPIGVIDPEVGDNLVIVPVIPLGQGVAFEYVYPQMRFLPTAQGVVVQPTADDIRVNPMREGVEVTSVSELKISAVSPEAAARAKLGALRPLTRVLKLEPWGVKSLAAFTPRLQALTVAAAQPDIDKRYQGRLDLARFYFANGFHAEALAVLKRVVADRPEAETDPEVRLLRGGALYMIGRLEDAHAEFSHASLRGNDEATFWLAATRATAGDLDGAAEQLKRTGPIIQPYPKSLKVPLGTVVMETALSQGDLKQAKHFIDIIRIDSLNRIEKAQLDYEEGRIFEQEEKFDEAIAKYESVITGSHRPSAAKAVVARAELLLRLERISRAQAIAELEKMRFAWRGDEFEFRLLRRLGQLYIEDNRYREGLTAYRQAATYFRTHPEAPAITQAMSDAFTKLFLEDAADDIAPVTALAVYEEFKELTPAGARGDEMIRHLADRLVGVDLIDRATNLLANQVSFRLQGVDKARVGAQLALIHILGREYDQALQVLSETEAPGMPDTLQTQRRHLRAKSEIGKNNSQRALDILIGDNSRDAELLRTEVFWNARDWNNVAQTMRRMLRVTEAKPGQPLDIEQASHVLNYAIALTLSGNERALVRVRDDYAAEMDKTPLKDAFRLISTSPTEGLVRPGDVAAVVQQVEQFKSFLGAYRQRLKTQSLSELVPGRSLMDSVTPDEPKGAKTKAPAKTPPKTPAAGAGPAAGQPPAGGAAPPAAPGATPAARPQAEAAPARPAGRS